MELTEGGVAITTPLDTMAVDVLDDVCDRLTAEAFGGSVPPDATRSYPVSAVCSALDVPAHQWPLFARCATDYLDPDAIEQLYWHLDVLIADRCCAPRDDLLSELIALEVDGDGLTVDDLHTIVAVLLAGAELG
ncbi:cytochrome P450 [Mycolicibacterium iranicum]|uniref:Cytochrome P450 n=1 Tax=Mycolicibacterium iranicum TaxID=912594 RepID=A0A839Q202_MYCIR|nr:hypothetical protein [Mycolicibacterium iranicum]MBB2990368.1 cytochrome P450 [Mycolicibacterium iranicum]